MFHIVSVSTATPQCQSHQLLTSADRINNCSAFPSPVNSDRNLTQGWYRFSGAAGTKMPERQVPAGLYSCGTYGPGWLNGIHPNQTNQTLGLFVCYRWGYTPCQWGNYVWVTNCGSFFVYYLYPTPTTNALRYCGSPWIREKDTTSSVHASVFVDWNKVSLNSFTLSSFNILPKRETNQCKFDPIWYRNGPPYTDDFGCRDFSGHFGCDFKRNFAAISNRPCKLLAIPRRFE